jgi:hypothetical protein
VQQPVRSLGAQRWCAHGDCDRGKCRRIRAGDNGVDRYSAVSVPRPGHAAPRARTRTRTRTHARTHSFARPDTFGFTGSRSAGWAKRVLRAEWCGERVDFRATPHRARCHDAE